MSAPNLASSAFVLRRFDPTPEEVDVAHVLEHIQSTHVAVKGGLCGACGTSWPCEQFVDGQSLAVQYIGRAADRRWAAARARIARLDEADARRQAEERRKRETPEESA